jgi:hypothetical protein
MTKQELAELICTELAPNEWGEMADILFDEVINTSTSQNVQVIYDELMAAGVDVGPICKKKRPT